MTDLTFEAFPKIARLKRPCVITEKVDGTNAQLVFNEDGAMLVGSRKRQIWPEGYGNKPKGCDNFAFANWAYAHQDQLFEFLGVGRHYGEWAGLGIQRGYGLDHKRFYLFNTGRFGKGRQEIPDDLRAVGLDVVPVLYSGDFDTTAVDRFMAELNGSSRVNGYNDPEGIIVYLTAAREYFKVTYEMDDGKWRHE